MKYINTVTGNIVESAAKISGGDWKPVKKSGKEQQKDPAQQKDPEGTGADDK